MGKGGALQYFSDMGEGGGPTIHMEEGGGPTIHMGEGGPYNTYGGRGVLYMHVLGVIETCCDKGKEKPMP